MVEDSGRAARVASQLGRLMDSVWAEKGDCLQCPSLMGYLERDRGEGVRKVHRAW